VEREDMHSAIVKMEDVCSTCGDKEDVGSTRGKRKHSCGRNRERKPLKLKQKRHSFRSSSHP